MPLPRSLPLRRLILAGCLASLAGALPVLAQDGTTSLTATLELADPLTGDPMTPSAGQMVRLGVTLTDAATGQHPRRLPLMGWVRPVQPGNSSCEQAIRGFLTTGAVPRGSLDLNAVVLAMLSRDGSVGLIDPRLDLQSANMIAAFKLPEMPAGLAVDRRNMRLLAALPQAGQILALPVPGGEAQVLTDGLTAPGDLALTDDGDIWLGTSSGGRLDRIAPDGSLRDRTDLGSGRVHLVDDPDQPLLAFASDGGFRLIERLAGKPLLTVGDGPPLSDAAAIGEIGVLALPKGGTRVLAHYTDAPDTPQAIPIGSGFQRLSVSPEGRFAIAWTPGSAAFVMIDLALGQAVQPAALNDATVAEARIYGDAAFLLSHDGAYVGVINLSTVELGKPANIIKVPLGQKGPNPKGDAKLLVPLAPSPQLLAVDPATQTGFVIMAKADVNGMPPKNAARLRGGIPQQVLAVDRSLEERLPGRFEVVWAFDAGDYELMLSTGVTGLSSCLRFSVQGQRQAQGIMPVRLEVEGGGGIRVGREEQLRLRFYNDEGDMLPMPALNFTVPSLKSGWRARATAQPQPDGSLLLRVTLPHEGIFALQPTGLPPGMGLRSAAVIDARQEGD